jgi:hypothetical protein
MPRRGTVVAVDPRKPNSGFRNDPALRELLDHVARQLAQEYLRLMKEADRIEGASAEDAEEVIR